MRPQRGFKRLAEEIAQEAREELGLKAHDPLDPFLLAEHLLIPVEPFTRLSTLGVSSHSVDVLSASSSPISAFTAFVGSRKSIYFNPNHSPRRTANSVAHELAHVLLEHEPTSTTTTNGQLAWHDLQETEAAWLGGAILVPRTAALRWLESNGSIAGGATHYGVSVELFEWRVNHTGVAIQLRRRKAAKGGAQ